MRRHKINILRLPNENEHDADGFPLSGWVPITENPLWADVVDMGSREFYASASDNRETIIRCNIAYRNDITADMRISWGDKQYKIIRIYNGDYRKNGLDIDASMIEGAM